MTDRPTLDYLPWLRSRTLDPRPCVRDDDHELTYAEFEEWVEAAAEQLAELGLGPGQVLAIMLPNRVELLVAIVAAWRLGATATPVNPAFTANEANYQIDDADATLVLNPGDTFPNGCSPSGGRRSLAVADLRRTPRGPVSAPVTTEPSDLALLIYTSGSTGRPKGVMLSHANVDAMTSSMLAHVGTTPDDHCLLFLPLFHANALFVSFLSTIRAGGQLSVMGRFSPEAFYEAVERLRPTFFSGVPTIFAMLLSQYAGTDMSSVRYAVCGAAPASKELLEAAEKTLGVTLIEGYGLTEGTCASCSNPIDGVRKIGTVGPALPGQQVAIMDPEGRLLPVGERGEVVIKGANLMVGYLNRPEATAATLKDGWLHTGDVGILDEDGYLRLVDRIKDMIIRGGENLYPKEIESVLLSHPDLMEAAVIGAADPTYGEVPVAYVAPYPGRSVDVDELLELCRANLTRVKVPVTITVRESLPKNPIGKLDKPTLRAQHAASTATTGA